MYLHCSYGEEIRSSIINIRFRYFIIYYTLLFELYGFERFQTNTFYIFCPLQPTEGSEWIMGVVLYFLRVNFINILMKFWKPIGS